MNGRIHRTFFLFSFLVLASFLFAPLGLAATSDYPNRPIEVVVPTNPGGINDTAARILNNKVSEILNITLITSNKPAGGGVAGLESVINAKPDGYTILCWADSSLMLIPLLYPEKTYTYRSLQPIAWFAYAPNAIVVRSDSPFKTLQELLDFAKKNPGKLNYGSTGATHISRVSMELIRKGAGVDIVHVPYQGGGPLKTAILGGHVDVACDSIVAVNPLVKAGNLRALAICSEKRHDELPQIPTVSELGYPNASLPVRAGYMAPLGTAPPIIDKWNQAIQKSLADPTVVSQLIKASLTIGYLPLEAMTKAMDGPSQILSEWVKEMGLAKK